MDDYGLTALISAFFIVTFSSIYWRTKVKSLSKEEEMVLYSKKKAYDILLGTMTDYWKENPNGDFNDFMKKMWTSDYPDCKRDYSEWKYLLYMIKPI